MRSLFEELLNWLGQAFRVASRWCWWHGRSLNHCWICGANPGMGRFWNGHMTCDACYDRWHQYHRPKDGFYVDWRGIGRYVPKDDTREKEVTDGFED